MLRLVHASFATVTQLFEYKANHNFKLEHFPGYSEDQWGIKAHNRPWVENVGEFREGQKIIEIGGAYSSLPRYLGKKYASEAWVGDDFGEYTNENIWSRWGDPKELPKKYPDTKYIFEPFGIFSPSYPSGYFDRIFSVSTLEHIPTKYRLDVFKDMNRCMAINGLQIHSIDVNVLAPTLSSARKIVGDKFSFLGSVSNKFVSEIMSWINILKQSGISIDVKIPNSIHLFNRITLIESPDIVYKYYPPINSPKKYKPTASLLLIIKKC